MARESPRLDPNNRLVFLYGAREVYPATKVREAATVLRAKLNSVAGVSVAAIDSIQTLPFDDDASSCLSQEIE